MAATRDGALVLVGAAIASSALLQFFRGRDGALEPSVEAACENAATSATAVGRRFLVEPSALRHDAQVLPLCVRSRERLVVDADRTY